jgi:flagella basal body P-ring formation protein FlgA
MTPAIEQTSSIKRDDVPPAAALAQSLIQTPASAAQIAQAQIPQAQIPQVRPSQAPAKSE